MHDVLPIQLANSGCHRLLREMGAEPESPAANPSGVAQGGEWAMGPNKGGLFPAGRFRLAPPPVIRMQISLEMLYNTV